MKYAMPFHVENQVIYDANGEEVRLWGVNYYAPFHHNYLHMKDMGVDHYRAIDRDIADFKRLGVQLVRMHLFDREISDLEGNLVENEHLRVYDYLLDKLEENGIYVFITTMAWWPSTETQRYFRKTYQDSSLGHAPTMGFGNFCAKHMLMWHPYFLDCQERYIRGLFSHRSAFSGKALTEYSNIPVVEIINEPAYPRSFHIEKLRANRAEVEKNPIAKEELLLVDMYDQHIAQTGEEDTFDAREAFCAGLVDKYLNRMFPLVDEYFQGRAIKSHIWYEFHNPPFRRVLKENKSFDCFSLTFYGGSHGGAHIAQDQIFEKDILNSYAKRYYDENIFELGKAYTSYEWAIQLTLTACDMPAEAHLMASTGAQIVAYFTYTPRDVAAYNPGWLQQYLSITHTPRRAIGFAAGGEVFARTKRGEPLPTDRHHWQTDLYQSNCLTDVVVYANDGVYIAAGDTDVQPQGDVHCIKGSGSNPLVEHKGNGAYYMDRVDENTWEMLVLPDQFYVNEPFPGRNYDGNGFPNRDCDINKVPVVSRLRERGSEMKLHLPGFDNPTITFLQEGVAVEVKTEADGSFIADAGRYIIRR